MEEKAEKEKLKQLVLEINERQEEEEQALIGLSQLWPLVFLFPFPFIICRCRFSFGWREIKHYLLRYSGTGVPVFEN